MRGFGRVLPGAMGREMGRPLELPQGLRLVEALPMHGYLYRYWYSLA